MANTAISGQLAAFITRAEALGFPVAMLRDVQRNYSFDEAERENETIPWRNHINFLQRTMKLAADISFSKPVGEAAAVESIYHEATHAWLDLHEYDADVKKIQADAERYYEASKLTDGSSVSDATRVFTEAAAAYVAHRASRWALAMEALTINNEEPDPGSKANARAFLVRSSQEAKHVYNTEMTKRVFGYQYKRRDWSTTSDQVDTRASLHGAVKELCDRKLLEGKIQDTFDFNAPLVGLWQKLANKYPEINQ